MSRNGNSTGQTSCPGALRVPTDRECAVLERIRAAALEARDLARQVAALEAGGDTEALVLARGRLEELRRLRRGLDIERQAAAEERMRLLGHID